ncbi:hypothetical protein CRYUN_Cryun03dG0081100 [Craigia yunnanensis]
MVNKKKIKEDDKMEKTIRGLLKLPENKRCFNCNLLVWLDILFAWFLWSPICLYHLTFVCTTCSGIHGQDKFTSKHGTVDVILYLMAGMCLDPHMFAFSNLHRLRDFIKHVYVEKKYTGERSDRLPGLRLVMFRDTVDSSESMKVSVFSGRSKSPLYEDRHDGVLMKDIVLLEEVMQIRYDGPGSVRRQDNHSFSRREPVTRSGSSDHQIDRSGSPVVRPVRDILGENAPALQTSSGGMESLIDFSRVSEPSNAEAAPNMQQEPPSSDGGNQSSDQLFSKGKAPPTSNANSLELLLFDLSAPSLEPVDNVSAVPGTCINCIWTEHFIRQCFSSSTCRTAFGIDN